MTSSAREAAIHPLPCARARCFQCCWRLRLVHAWRSVRVVDLTREMDRADKRPPGGFAVADYRLGDAAYPAIAAAVPSRLTVPLPLPRQGVFHAFVALAPAAGPRRPRRCACASA